MKTSDKSPKFFALTIFVLCLIPVFWIVRYCVDGWWSNNLIEFFHITSLKGGLYKALFIIGGLIVFFFVVSKIQSVSKITGMILSYVVGILGPLFIFHWVLPWRYRLPPQLPTWGP
jgi:hypothetical protein